MFALFRNSRGLHALGWRAKVAGPLELPNKLTGHWPYFACKAFVGVQKKEQAEQLVLQEASDQVDVHPVMHQGGDDLHVEAAIQQKIVRLVIPAIMHLQFLPCPFGQPT